MDASGNSEISLSNVFIEFLEVAIHNILYYRRIYPETIFHTKQKYCIPVHVSVFPELNHYIAECLKMIQQLINKKHLQCVAMVFYDKNSRVLERFIFNLLNLKANVSTKEISDGTDPYLIKLQESMRAFCLKLSICDTSLKPLGNDVTFQINAYTTETTMVSLTEDQSLQEFPWIELDKKEFELEDAYITPLKSINCQLLHVEMYVEQKISF